MRAWLSRKALRYFGTQVVPQILARMGENKVAPKHGEASGFKYSLTDFFVRDVAVESIDYDFIVGHGIGVTVRGITAMMVANYSVEGTSWYNPIWSHGQVFMPLGSGTEMHATVQIGVADGKPKVELEKLTTRVELADFYTEHSKAHHLAWMAGKLFREQVAEKIADGMRKDMQDNVDVDLANLLDGLDPWVNIPLPLPHVQGPGSSGRGSMVDKWAVNVVLCHLDVGSDYLSADLHLEVVDLSRPWLAYQVKPKPLPVAPPAMFEARMMSVSMTSWAFSGALYVFGEGGLLNHTMEPDDFREYWYGQQYNISVDLWAPQGAEPAIELHEGSVTSSVTVRFDVKARDIHTGWTIAHVTADTPLKMRWNVSVAGGSPQMVKVGAEFISATPLEHFHGTIPHFFVEKFINKAMHTRVMPKIHELLQKTFPVQSKAGVALERTSFSIEPTNAAFFTDIAWDPTAWLTYLHGQSRASTLMRQASAVKQEEH